MEKFVLGTGMKEVAKKWPDFLNLALDRFSDYFGEQDRVNFYQSLFNATYFLYDAPSINLVAQIQTNKTLFSNIKSHFDPGYFTFSVSNSSLYAIGANCLNFGKDHQKDLAAVNDFLSLANNKELENYELKEYIIDQVTANKQDIFCNWLVANFIQTEVKTSEDFDSKQGYLFENFLDYNLKALGYECNFSKGDLNLIKSGLETYNGWNFDPALYRDIHQLITGKNYYGAEALSDQQFLDDFLYLANNYLQFEKTLNSAKNQYLSSLKNNFMASGMNTWLEEASKNSSLIFGKDYILKNSFDALRNTPINICFFDPYLGNNHLGVSVMHNDCNLTDKTHELLHLISAKSSAKKTGDLLEVNVKLGLNNLCYKYQGSNLSFTESGRCINELLTEYLAIDLSSPEFSSAHNRLFGVTNKKNPCIYDSYISIIRDLFDAHKEAFKKAYIGHDLEPVYAEFGKENYEKLSNELDKLMEFNDSHGRKLDGIVAAYQTDNKDEQNLSARLAYITEHYIGSKELAQEYINKIKEVRKLVEDLEKSEQRSSYGS